MVAKTKQLFICEAMTPVAGTSDAAGMARGEPGPRLHPDYTFDNFVVGPSNRLAQASCVAVSQSLGNTYNPLFLYEAIE